MNNDIFRHPLWLFVAPASWLILLGFAEVAKITSWGASGHPSNALVMFIYILLSAPVFGILGVVYAVLGKTRDRFHAKTISIILNSGLICVGIGFGLWWFI